MTVERELLGRLQAAMQAVDIDVDALVEEAWNEARDEVQTTLKRLITQDLLDRSLASLRGGASGPTPPATGPASAPSTSPSRSPTAAGHTARDDGADSALTYLFGVVAEDATLPTDDVPLLPGGMPLRFVEGPGCRALVCDVDPQVFEALREPGPDGLDVLAEAARAHDAILARFVHAPVLPLGLGTALSDDHAVQQLLYRHADRLRAELVRVAGQAEWAVTVYPSAGAGEAARIDAATSGRDYLEQQRDALYARDDRWEHQERFATELHEALAGCAAASHRVHARPLEESVPPLLHGVYLLDAGGWDRFSSTVTSLRTEYPDVTIELGGPWPPYHFVALDLAVDPAPVS